jgi:hypothetical protein
MYNRERGEKTNRMLMKAVGCASLPKTFVKTAL